MMAVVMFGVMMRMMMRGRRERGIRAQKCEAKGHDESNSQFMHRNSPRELQGRRKYRTS
jgi:hypothetical protein